MELSMNSIMAKKHTGLSNRSYIATLFLFVVVILLACTKGKEQPSASVPADCQQFLDKYFDAWEIKRYRYTAGPFFLPIARRPIKASGGQSGNMARMEKQAGD